MSELTLEELSSLTGEPISQLQEWLDLGLLGADAFERSRLSDLVDRIRVIGFLRDRNVDLDAVGAGVRSGALDIAFGPYIGPSLAANAGPRYSLQRAADLTQLPIELVERLCHVLGVSQKQESVTTADLEILKSCKVALDAGLPAEALLQLWRVFADAFERVAEAEVRLFHFYVHERLRAEGVSGPTLLERTHTSAQQLSALMGPAMRYFHQRGMANAILDDLRLHLAPEASRMKTEEPVSQLSAAVMFTDLSRFTPLTEAMGDLKAARVLERFGSLVRDEAARWNGRVVKQIGDAFLLVFSEARSALRCAVELEADASKEPSFPAVRSGVHWGSILYREGDYIGTNVNIAARLADAARPHEILVTGALRREVGAVAEVEFIPAGKRAFKGVVEELEVFEAHAGRKSPGLKVLDPVCGMELAPEEVAARLSLGGSERLFCSERCLRKFMDAPQSYSS